MNEIMSVIKKRRSVRKYLDVQLKNNEIESILQAGAFAPSAHNEQPWHFTVIQKKELLDDMSRSIKKAMCITNVDWVKNMGSNENFHVFYNAPTVLLVSGREDAISPIVDCSAAIQNMLLYAESINVGSCWIGLIRFLIQNPEYNYKNTFELPQGYKPFYAVALGYKGYESNSMGPKRAENIVNYIK